MFGITWLARQSKCYKVSIQSVDTSEESKTYLDDDDGALAMLRELLGGRADETIQLFDLETVAEVLPTIGEGVEEASVGEETLVDPGTIAEALLPVDDKKPEARVDKESLLGGDGWKLGTPVKDKLSMTEVVVAGTLAEDEP